MKKILQSLFLLLLCFEVVFAQERTISGKVVDSENLPIPGVTIKIKGESSVTQSNANGLFTIKTNMNNPILVFTFIGYNQLELPYNGSSITAKMTDSNESLSEVVVTGYSTKLKREFTGAVSNISIENSMNQANGSFDQLLQGQASGLNVKTGSGQPGRSADVVIRGKGSINGSNTPLYILDGVAIQPSDFSTMNQNDFESITVLKDASSTAIYGSRGANGVIVITTKKGVAGKLRLSYDVQTGTSRIPENKLGLMNTQQKLDFEQNIAGNPWGWSDAEFADLRKVNINWNDYVFRKGLTQSHQLSASGGNDKTTFYTSLNYYDEEGVVIETGLKKYNGRINVSHSTDNLKIGTNIGAGWSKYIGTFEGDQSVGSPLNTVIWALPYENPYTESGGYTNSIQFPYWLNPVEDLKLNPRTDYQLKGNGNIFLQYNLPFIKNLSYKINAGGDYSQIETFNITKNGTQAAEQAAEFGSEFRRQGELRRGLARTFYYTVTNTLNYKFNLDKEEKHQFNTSLSSEIFKSQGRSMFFTGFGLLNPFDNEAGLVEGTAANGYIPTVGGGFPDTYSITSFFGTLDYSFNNKYFISFSGRRDGSSRLSEDGRFFNTGSVGASWIVSEENFMKSTSKTLNFFKLRANIGSAGNQEGIGNFPYLQQYTRTTYGGNGGLFINRLGNNNLTWERRRTAGVGADMEFFNSKLTATIDYYNSLTKGLFFEKFVPATSGGNGTILGNEGELSNKGIELNLGVKIINTKDFKWAVNANYAYNKSNVESLPDGQDFQLYKSFQALKVGSPLNSFYLVEYAGVNPANGNSQYVAADGSTTEIYDPNNLKILGTSDAPTNAGLTTTFNYKGLEFSAFGVLSTGNYIYNNARLNVENSAYVTSGFSINGLNAWTSPGQITNFPRLSESTESQTTRFLEKGDFFRLRNVQIAYTIPNSLTSKLKMQNLRLFVQGQNLYTSSTFQGWDPEVSSVNDADVNSNASVSGSQYPSLKRVTFGLNVTF